MKGIWWASYYKPGGLMHICKFISWVTASTRYQSGASWVIDCTPVGSNTGKPLEKPN